jgi:acetylglutamate/LysW-gamma-L-alpha-aminoadipate kinase
MNNPGILVVKIGGGAGVDMARCAADIEQLAQQRPVIVVHGVSDALNRLCEARGVAVRTLTSPTGHTSRYTDPATRDLFVEAAEGVNAELVRRLREHGIEAVGLTGEHVPVCGERKTAVRALVDGRVRIVRDDYTGTITGVNTALICERLMQQGDGAPTVIVIPPLAISMDGLLNIDGDRASAAVAAGVGAAELVILSNVRGLYRAYGDESSLVAHIGRGQIETALEWAQGRMKRKIIGAGEALSGGVRRVMIADGRVDAPISRALNGSGTHFE